MSSSSSPMAVPARAASAAASVWAVVTVNATGPIENAGLYVMLTDQASAFKNTWFYVEPALAALINETAIAAITANKKVYAELTSTNPASSILRFHLMA
jgi:hypothetical protein